MFNIVLISPEIPLNTGAIGRLAVNTNSTLHLIRPLGFSIDDKSIKRAGLDYWEKLDLKVWNSVEEFFEEHSSSRLFFATTKSDTPYFKMEFQKDDFLIFGSETKGIKEEILNRFKSKNITIPMGKEGRSLNLAMSVAIILYKAIEQNFEELNYE